MEFSTTYRILSHPRFRSLDLLAPGLYQGSYVTADGTAYCTPQGGLRSVINEMSAALGLPRCAECGTALVFDGAECVECAPEPESDEWDDGELASAADELDAVLDGAQ